MQFGQSATSPSWISPSPSDDDVYLTAYIGEVPYFITNHLTRVICHGNPGVLICPGFAMRVDRKSRSRSKQ